MKKVRISFAIIMMVLGIVGVLGTKRAVTVRADCVGLACLDQPSCGPLCFCNTTGDAHCHAIGL